MAASVGAAGAKPGRPPAEHVESLSRALERVARLVTRRPLPCSRWSRARGRRRVLGLSSDPAPARAAGIAELRHLQGHGRLSPPVGDDAVIVLVREDLAHLVLTSDIERLLGLEGCISGNLPRSVKAPGGASGPCAQLAKTKPVRVAYGPRRSSTRPCARSRRSSPSASSGRPHSPTRPRQQRASWPQPRACRRRRSARRPTTRASSSTRSSCATSCSSRSRTGSAASAPQRSELRLLAGFGPAGRRRAAQARFAYLFPNAKSALIQVRLRPELTDDQRRTTIALVRKAVAMPQWGLHNHGTYTVTGAPVVVADLSTSLQDSILLRSWPPSWSWPPPAAHLPHPAGAAAAARHRGRGGAASAAWRWSGPR